MKTVMITGATSGIGRACAEAFAREGSHLILLARRKDRLTDLKAKLEKAHSVKVLIFTVDIQKRSEVERFATTHAQELTQVDVLINNAGLAKGTDKMPEASLDDWDAMIDTNVKGLLYITRMVIPDMVKSKRGHIINIGSVAGRWVYPGGGVYCATKYAVRALNEGLRMDVAGTGIRVTNVAPGMVATEFSAVRLEDEAEAAAVYADMKPLSPEDIAETVLWCVSRPAHVDVQEILIFPTDQAAVGQVHRRK